MKLSLNISERLFSIGILNQFKGDLATLAIVLEDIKKFGITEEEWVKANKEIMLDDEGKPAQWKWDDDKGGLKDIEVETKVAEFMVKKIQELSNEGQLSLQDKAALSLNNKLTTLTTAKG